MKYTTGSITSLSRNQSGAILPLAVLIVAVLLLVLISVITLGHRALLRAELQATVDAAAHAGASVMCSSTSCWDFTKKSVVAIIREHQLRYDARWIDTIDLAPGAGPLWQNGVYQVRIYRGRWWSKKKDSWLAPSVAGFRVHGKEIRTLAEDTRFEPFEGEPGAVGADWNARQGATPNFMASNAVYVRIDLKDTGTLASLFSRFGFVTQSFSVQAVALAGETAPTNVAPFAIPLCALLDNNGEFIPEKSCSYDRFFTKAGGFQDSSGATVVPGFFATALGTRTDIPCSGHQCSAEVCSTVDPQIPDGSRFDQYALVGVPEGNGIDDGLPADQFEDRIKQLLDNNTCLSAEIGKRFIVLNQGLQSAETAKTLHQLLFEAKTNTYATRCGKMKRFTSDSTPELDKLVRKNLKPNSQCSGQKTGFFGSCNSEWAKMDLLSLLSSENLRDHPERCDSGSGDNIASNIDGDGTAKVMSSEANVLRISVPVVSDLTQRCRNDTLGIMVDPPFDHTANQTIIGYVSVDIYDFDIGADPPGAAMEISSGAPGDAPRQCGGFEVSHGPWGFAPKGTRERCNLVRARIPCKSELIPTRDGGEMRSPILVK